MPEQMPVVIEATGVSKTFRIPERRVDSLKERALHPFTRMEYRELRALRDVSFEVRRGEFFGIVGRNGSGKSSLLKILASIYGADAGRVRMAGRLAPFIELGVGFNPDLTARENAVLNGVLMGLSRREAGRRLDAVLDFADLRGFLDLKLKNYSSGMMVRLAFAVMVEADADIMLVDEVLAVGDAAFAQKCMDVFQERRAAGKTIVLVTHDMGTVQSLCDRAMLLHDGDAQYVGEPEEAAARYYRINFSEGVDAAPAGADPLPDINVRMVEASLRTPAGERMENVEQGEPLTLDVLLEARQELTEPTFRFQFVSAEGTLVFAFNPALADGFEGPIPAGGRVRLVGAVENPLVPGRYYVDCWVRRGSHAGDLAAHGLRALEFVVFGPGERTGLVNVDSDVRAVPEP